MVYKIINNCFDLVHFCIFCNQPICVFFVYIYGVHSSFFFLVWHCKGKRFIFGDTKLIKLLTLVYFSRSLCSFILFALILRLIIIFLIVYKLCLIKKIKLCCRRSPHENLYENWTCKYPSNVLTKIWTRKNKLKKKHKDGNKKKRKKNKVR